MHVYIYVFGTINSNSYFTFVYIIKQAHILYACIMFVNQYLDIRSIKVEKNKNIDHSQHTSYVGYAY